jgi:peptide/nickel transport system permease protein
VASGDLGRSYLYHAPVSELIRARLPITLTLGLTGLCIALVTAIPLGVLAAMYEASVIDGAIMMIAVIGQAMPGFWLGLTLIIWLGVRLQWLPISGVDTWQGYILPGIVLAFSAIPALMRLTRGGMVDALASDYIRTARAKGLSRARIVLGHALRNAAMPVVAVAAVQLGFMLGGSIVIEAVFSLNGVGYLAWESISKNDFPVVQAVVLFLATIYIVLTLAADLLNAVLDPRLRAA